MLNVWQGDDLKRVAKRNNNDQVDLRMYELVGFVAQIKEEGSKKHMVSFINGIFPFRNYRKLPSNSY